MATDSTELTFVRCPSCRSLVPAVSTRCRMCDATLDASQKLPEEESNPAKSGRVRQRTVTLSSSEVSAATEMAKESDPFMEEFERAYEEEKPAEAPLFNNAAEDPAADLYAKEDALEHALGEELPQEESSNDDPLSAYIEEVEVPEENSSLVDSDPWGESSDSLMENAPIEGIPTVEQSAAVELQEPQSEEAPAFMEEATAESEHVQAAAQAEPVNEMASLEEPAEVETPEPSHKEEQEPAPQESRPRVLIESGNRRMNKPHGLSFGRPRDEKREEKQPQENRGIEKKAEKFQHQEKAQERQAERYDVRPENKFDNKEGRPSMNNNRNEEQRNRPTEQRGAPQKNDSQRAYSQKKQAGVPGRLFGWLISYSNPTGQATEVREGGFFITKASLKAGDLVLDEDSISTPHALASVTVHDGFRVQDLMSEGGVYLKRRGASEFQRVTEVTRLEHGDAVKFGEVEFVLALVADPVA